MIRRARLLLLAAALGCSGLDETDGMVVALEVRSPEPKLIEVGETLQFTAVALNADGEPVDAAVTWSTPDASVEVGSTGLVTGRIADQSARVQARVGSLSTMVTYSVIARADTLVLPGDSVLTVPAGQLASAPLVARLDSFDPAGPLANRTIVYEIAEPVFADPAARTVELPGGVTIDTVTTGSDGTPAPPVTLSRAAGQTQPQNVVVVVRAFRTRDAPVPGSGQRFRIELQ